MRAMLEASISGCKHPSDDQSAAVGVPEGGETVKISIGREGKKFIRQEPTYGD